LENWRKCKEEQQKCNGTLIKMSSRYLLRYGPPRISCEERLKRSGLPTLESYNPSVQNYQWERSTTMYVTVNILFIYFDMPSFDISYIVTVGWP